MNKDPKLYLGHILDEIEMISQFVSGGKDVFMEDSMVYYAVLRSLQTLSESTQKIPDSIKTENPHIEWREISGFRNVLVHDYLEGYDRADIWDVVENDLPRLKNVIRKYIPDWKLRDE